MQEIEYHEIPVEEVPELPDPQLGQYSVCVLILKQHFAKIKLKQSNGKNTKEIIPLEKFAAIILMLMVMPGLTL